MTSINLKIGILSETSTWSNHIMWLYQDEAGYPSEVTDKNSIRKYPILVVPYEKLIEYPSIFSDHTKKKRSTLIVCPSHRKKEAKKSKFPKKILPVDFHDAQYQTGHYTTPCKGNPLNSFFPERTVHPETRKDHNINLMIRRVQVSPPAKTIVQFETISGDLYPLLICGTVEEGGRFAVITADHGTILCQHSNLGPLLYLAALEWCLMDWPFVRKWYWPNGKRITISLTFDFETVATYPDQKRSWRSRWWNRGFDHFLLGIGLRPILKFLEEKKVPATWFVLGSQALHTPKLVKKLAFKDMMEIGGHGDFHMDIDRSAKRFDEDDLSVQKKRLETMKQMIESIVPVSIEGFRAPGLYANHDTLVALQENGLLWDSSSSPQTDFSTRWLFLPHYPIKNWKDKSEIDVVEIPVTEPWDQWCPIHGSPHSAQEYLNEMLEDFKFLYFVGGIQTLLIHPYWIVTHKAWWKAVEQFIDKVLQIPEVAVSSCGQVYSSWASRKRTHLQAEYNNQTSTIRIQVKDAEPQLSLMVHIPEEYRATQVKLGDLTSVPFSVWNDLNSIVFLMGREGDCKYEVSLCKR